jgi:ABC-type transport system involved in Fe-S cluster assembly fused permease/ATPase subunit
MKALDKATSGRTSILIAHRLSTVVNCDQELILRISVSAETFPDTFLSKNCRLLP